MPSPTRPAPEPVFIRPGGERSDAELHAPMLDNNPGADALFVLGAIADAVEGGMSQEMAVRLFAPRD